MPLCLKQRKPIWPVELNLSAYYVPTAVLSVQRTVWGVDFHCLKLTVEEGPMGILMSAHIRTDRVQGQASNEI